MARPKRPPHPILMVAREHIQALAPELVDAPLALRQLDGPPDAPRFAVSVDACQCAGACPSQIIDAQHCPIRSCALRHSLRLLLNRNGALVRVIHSDRSWK